ncbi:hypothetical protein KXV38_008569 [Aspergillus fumigatus]|nr:hypothetical protein KXX38_008968 [Aspergillus fumigatus]KAH3611728.1 hypothetical protein KXV38_008569 [Aspergillus fumigatus]
MESEKEFDLVLVGPTGYTGRLCAEHIVKNLPTNLKWALAGRSVQKIEVIAKELKTLNPDRAAPEILAVQLNRQELEPLVQRTKVIINCVGPYHLYSTPVVEACANHGTHYVDATGETPWIREIIEKYHDVAKSNGAIIIPSVGVESAPADILAWSVVKRVREDLSSDTKEVIGAIEEMKSSGPSGGTLNTVLTIFDSLFLLRHPQIHGPLRFGRLRVPQECVRSVRDLGTLTTSPSAMADITIVHRSSTLMPEFYGPLFYFRQFVKVRNALVGIIFHYAFIIGLCLLTLPPVRALVRQFVYAAGQGPRKEDSVNDRVEYRAVATADQKTAAPQRVFGKFKYEGSMYALTGLLLAEAAMVILEETERVKKVSRCGIVTPATLGQPFVDRLEKVGCHLETQVFDY